MYDAKIGRMLQPDAFYDPGNPQSLNRYSYVLNNPLRYTDPTGHKWDDEAGGCTKNTCPEVFGCYMSCAPPVTITSTNSDRFKADWFVTAKGQCQKSLTCGFVGGWTGGSCGPGGAQNLQPDISSGQIPRGGAPNCTATFEETFWVQAEGTVTDWGDYVKISLGIRLCANPETCSAPKFLRGNSGAKLSNGVTILGAPEAKAIDEFGEVTTKFERAIRGGDFHYEASLQTDAQPDAIQLDFVVDPGVGIRYVHYDFNFKEALLGEYDP